jgi:predicted secreted hydrolase
MKKKIILTILLTVSLAITVWLVVKPGGLLIRAPVQEAEIVSALEVQATPAAAEGFTQASGPIEISFPADHGPHPDYQTEWWYYTGNLNSSDGQHFGFQLTFFRRALLPTNQAPDRLSDWSASQVYMAHFALTDPASQQFYSSERLERGAAGLAGAQADPFQVWLGDWQVELTGQDTYRLVAASDEVAIDLSLKDIKGPILQGENGYSQKGPDPGNASYYVSQPRLDTQGTIRVGQEQYSVSGWSWMDHEWSTSALSADQVGWDWFSIQLDNGSELMVFQIRKEDGSIDPFSSGTIINPDGSTILLAKDDFSIEVTDTWKSPRTQAVYPAGWRVIVPGAGIELTLEPHLADQELNVSFDYWEGAVKAQGEWGGLAVNGNGYVEMTGYVQSMAGEF